MQVCVEVPPLGPVEARLVVYVEGHFATEVHHFFGSNDCLTIIILLEWAIFKLYLRF